MSKVQHPISELEEFLTEKGYGKEDAIRACLEAIAGRCPELFRQLAWLFKSWAR